MAELLVRAKPHWKDSWDATKVSSLSKIELQRYNARSQVGDIIVVKPDGWKWGKEERLPNFVVVKIPSLSYTLAKQYESRLIPASGDYVMLKKRKWNIQKAYVDALVAGNTNEITIDNVQFSSKLSEKAP